MLIQAKFMKELLRDFFVPCKENGFKPRILGTQFFFILLGFLVGLKILTLVSFWGNFGATIFNQISQGDLYTLTNEARAFSGVEKLHVSSKLEAVAQLKLADMFQGNYFAHVSPSGVEPWVWFDKANYDYKLAGENLAMSFMSSDEVLKAWLNSESHRKNLLLNEFQEIGIAVGSGMINGQKTVAVVQVFGTPRAVSVLAVNNTKSVVKPLVITPKPTLRPTPKLTPRPIPNSTVSPQVTPKPIVKSSPISLGKVVAIVPQVKSAESERYLWPEYLSYFANDSFKKLMIIFAVIAMLILFLKIFVAFSIQFPGLILKAIVLIVISLSFVLIKDERFMLSKIEITNNAEITISNIK